MIEPHVKHLRANATRAEELLWHQLRLKRIGGLRFRRQFPIGPYIVDFICLPARLVVEVDGPTHAQMQGEDNLDGVVRTIESMVNAAAATPPPIPLPQGEGGPKKSRFR